MISEYFPNSVDTGSNETKNEFRSYIINENKQEACNSHANMFHIVKQYLNQEY